MGMVEEAEEEERVEEEEEKVEEEEDVEEEKVRCLGEWETWR